MERYFAAMGLNAAQMTDAAQMCTIAVSLLRGNAAKWFTKLERFDQHPTTFQGFKTSFLAKFEDIDAENIARDRLKTLV